MTLNSSNVIKNGFTILEVMIAMSISALIMVGAYSITSSAASVKSSLDRTNDLTKITISLQKLISSDIRMRTGGKFSLSQEEIADRNKTYLMYFETMNGLVFNKSVPVRVYYYLEDETLYRREFKKSMEYDMLIPLLNNITGMDIYTSNERGYVNSFSQDGYIYKYNLTLNNSNLSFIIGGGVY